LGVSRSGIYYQAAPISAEDLCLRHRIDEIYTKYPFYGSRRIAQQLQREGWAVGRKTVQRHMDEMGLTGICPGPNLSKRAQGHKVYPYLLRGLTAACPNHIWGIDITYIRLRGGWMYLAAVLDWYSRYVVSWQIDQSMEQPLVTETVTRALALATPQIFNSDQGSHFTSPHYTDLLAQRGVRISMDGKGRALDNIFTERLWRTIKYEDVYLKEYDCPRAARQGIGQFIEFYNHERLHQSLGYRPPVEFYACDRNTT